MSNPSKRRGTDAEVKLLAWLKDHGHPEAVRNPPAGTKDVGDLTCLVGHDRGDGLCWCDACGKDHVSPGYLPIVVEVKNHANVAAAINQGLAELDVEMVNAGASHGVLVVKRRGKGDPGQWLAIRRVENDPELGS
jgi:hypothetical protein